MSSLTFPTDSHPISSLESRNHTERARQILRAALELFARKGYAATSVREIVEAADVTNPMLYYYFDSKEGVFLELNQCLFESITARVREAIERAETFESRIEGIVRAHADECLEAPVALQFVYVALFGPSDSTPDFDVFEARGEMAESVRDVFEKALEEESCTFDPIWDPDELTEQLFGTINVHMMRALKEAERLESPQARLEHMESMLGPESRTRLIQFFLRGVGYR